MRNNLLTKPDCLAATFVKLYGLKTAMSYMQVVLTTRAGAEAKDNVLPVSYPKFCSMVEKGDTIFLGRYLVTGSEDSSLYLTVRFLVHTYDAVAGVCTVAHTLLSTLLLLFIAANDQPIKIAGLQYS